MAGKSVADVVGPWVDPDFKSGLIERCKQFWSVPVEQLPDLMIATYLNQNIARCLMLDEARRRLASGLGDDSELYDGQLHEALERASEKRTE